MLGKFKSQKGFTLVELLVVLSIMAVLAAIVVPAVSGVGSSASTTATNQETNQLTSNVQTFSGEDSSGRFPICPTATPGGTPFASNIYQVSFFTTNTSSKALVPNYQSTVSKAVTPQPTVAYRDAATCTYNGSTNPWAINPTNGHVQSSSTLVSPA